MTTSTPDSNPDLNHASFYCSGCGRPFEWRSVPAVTFVCSQHCRESAPGARCRELDGSVEAPIPPLYRGCACVLVEAGSMIFAGWVPCACGQRASAEGDPLAARPWLAEPGPQPHDVAQGAKGGDSAPDVSRGERIQSIESQITIEGEMEAIFEDPMVAEAWLEREKVLEECLEAMQPCPNCGNTLIRVGLLIGCSGGCGAAGILSVEGG